MSKPRVLIPISLQFSIRYLLRTGLLSQLSASLHLDLLLPSASAESTCWASRAMASVASDAEAWPACKTRNRAGW